MFYGSRYQGAGQFAEAPQPSAVAEQEWLAAYHGQACLFQQMAAMPFGRTHPIASSMQAPTPMELSARLELPSQAGFYPTLLEAQVRPRIGKQGGDLELGNRFEICARPSEHMHPQASSLEDVLGVWRPCVDGAPKSWLESLQGVPSRDLETAARRLLMSVAHWAMDEEHSGCYAVAALIALSEHYGETLVRKLLPSVDAMILDPAGAVTLVAMLEHGSEAAREQILDQLRNRLVHCCTHEHASKVVCTLVRVVHGILLDDVACKIGECSPQLSLNARGSAVVREVLRRRADAPTAVARVLKPLRQPAVFHRLATNTSGNYVLQAWVQSRPGAEEVHALVNLLIPRVRDYATHKFASHVVEKALSLDMPEKQVLLDLLFIDVERYAGDKFGNFVVQRMLEHCRGEQWEELVRRLKQVDLCSTTHGRHVHAMLESLEGLADALEVDEDLSPSRFFRVVSAPGAIANSFALDLE